METLKGYEELNKRAREFSVRQIIDLSPFIIDENCIEAVEMAIGYMYLCGDYNEKQ